MEFGVIRGLFIGIMGVLVSVRLIRASKGNDYFMNLFMRSSDLEKVVQKSKRFNNEEELIEYYKERWRMGGYFFLVFSIIIILITILNKGEPL